MVEAAELVVATEVADAREVDRRRSAGGKKGGGSTKREAAVSKVPCEGGLAGSTSSSIPSAFIPRLSDLVRLFLRSMLMLWTILCAAVTLLCAAVTDSVPFPIAAISALSLSASCHSRGNTLLVVLVTLAVELVLLRLWRSKSVSSWANFERGAFGFGGGRTAGRRSEERWSRRGLRVRLRMEMDSMCRIRFGCCAFTMPTPLSVRSPRSSPLQLAVQSTKAAKDESNDGISFPLSRDRSFHSATQRRSTTATTHRRSERRW